MFVSIPTAMKSTISVRMPHIVNELPPSRLPQLERRLDEIVAQAIVAARILLIAVATSALAGSSTGEQIGIALSGILTVLMMVSEQRVQLPYWLRMAGDGAIVALLISATGGVFSPILGVVLMLIPLGVLHGGSRAAIAATCMGIVILLLNALLDMPRVSDGLLAVLCVHFVAGVVVAWLSSMVQGAVACLYTGVQTHSMPVMTKTPAARYAEWQHANLRVVDAESQGELMTVARERAYDIVGAAVDVYLAGAKTPVLTNKTDSFVISSTVADEQSVMVVHRNPALLDPMQHEALEQLLVLVRMRSLTLASREQRARDYDAMLVLWQMIGHSQESTNALDQVTVSQRLVHVLGLEGMAMVAPGPERSIEALWQTPADSNWIDALDESYYEPLIDALRHEELRVVGDTVMVVPAQYAGMVPQALMVRGTVHDANIQRIVMMFADLVTRFDVCEREGSIADER